MAKIDPEKEVTYKATFSQQEMETIAVALARLDKEMSELYKENGTERFQVTLTTPTDNKDVTAEKAILEKLKGEVDYMVEV